MRESSPQGRPRSLLHSVLPWLLTGPCVLSYPCRWGNNFTVWHMSPGFPSWHNTAAAVINITWCGPCHLGSNGLFLNDFIMTHWPGMIVCPPSGGVLPTRLNSLFGTLHCLCEVFTVSDSGHLKQCAHQHF